MIKFLKNAVVACMMLAPVACTKQFDIVEPQSTESSPTSLVSAKVEAVNEVVYTTAPALNTWTVGTSGSTLNLSCAKYYPGLRAKFIAQSGNKFTVQIQRNDGKPFNGTGIGYIKATDLCGTIAGSTTFTDKNYYYLNVDFWATFQTGSVVFQPTITINNVRYYANPITVTAIQTYTNDACTSYAMSECVIYARCRLQGKTLPYSLFTYDDKVRIITTYSASANSVAIIKVTNSKGVNNGVGHVAYVEKVDGSTIYIAESNWSPGKITRRNGTMSSLNIVGFFK